MNIAIINQNGGKYLFEVPESISLKEGEKVKCDTKRGVTDGTVWADSITTDEPAAKLIGKLLGAKFPLKSVVGKAITSVKMFEQPEQPKQEPVKLYCVDEWALNQQYQSAAAKYARTLAEYIRQDRIARQNPQPLTMEQLRNMDGEPVWVMHQDGSGARWGIVQDTEYGLCAVVDDDTAYWFTDVCGTIAYRSKPGEATNER